VKKIQRKNVITGLHWLYVLHMLNSTIAYNKREEQTLVSAFTTVCKTADNNQKFSMKNANIFTHDIVSHSTCRDSTK